MPGDGTVVMVLEVPGTPASVRQPGAFAEFPDVEAVCAAWLRADPVAGIDDRVYTETPAEPTFPLIVVRRVGGVPVVREYLDAANIQIDVWADMEIDDPKAQARDAAAAARTRLLALAGETVNDPVGAFVSAVEDSLTLTWFPDPETGRARYLFSVLVYNHGLTFQ